MGGREILDPNIDPMAVIDELASGSATDGRGLTLGDVAGHRIDRFFSLWRTLHFVGALARRRLLGPADTLQPVKAEVQDNRAFDVFEAAHVLPCDIGINGRPGLHRAVHSPIIRGHVKAHLFGRTNAVHRLVNDVDQRCEDRGWRDAFLAAIAAAVAGDPPARVFAQTLVPGYAIAVTAAREAFERAIGAAERSAMGTPALFAPNGQPARPRGQDFRIGRGAADPRVRGINKAAVLRIYDEYRLGPAGLLPEQLATAARQADDWADLEVQWRSKWG